MVYSHPQPDAIYRIGRQEDLTYGVVVRIPGSYSETVPGLTTRAAAERWIAAHKLNAQRRSAPFKKRFAERQMA